MKNKKNDYGNKRPEIKVKVDHIVHDHKSLPHYVIPGFSFGSGIYPEKADDINRQADAFVPEHQDHFHEHGHACQNMKGRKT